VRSDAERLQDILEAIKRIQSRAQVDRLQQDELLQVWVLYHLQIVGEALRSLSSELIQRYPEIPWSQMVGLRNLKHLYKEPPATPKRTKRKSKQ